MQAKREFRDRPETEVAVLDALVDRTEDGMTVLELRAHAEVPIDDLEAALGALKADGLIAVEDEGSRTVIRPADRVVPDGERETVDVSLFDRLREAVGL